MLLQYAAITAIVGLIAVITTLVIHIAKYGEEKGAMRQRVLRLEQEMVEQKDIKDTVIELRTTVGMLTSTVTDLRSFLQTIAHMSGK